MVVFFWWCGCVFGFFCGGVVLFLWLSFCVFVVVWLSFCGGVVVCGCVSVVVWWCFCGGVLVVVLLWREALAKESCRQVLEKSVGGERPREVLEKRIGVWCKEVLEKSVVEKCCRDAL